MRLRRIDAENFGALQDCGVEGFGDGLTVVYGPNESGKSTYTALVRQVLYGFPDKRSKEYGFQPRSGGRAGRLVFEESGSEWAIARGEGPKGGILRIDTVSGAERPNLLNEVVGSIAEQTYRVVFGFGLDELAAIESGGDKEIVARLFAGAFGLSVNPMDARKELEESAAGLFKTRGNATVNGLLSQIRDVKAEIRDLEGQAREFAGEQARLKDLAERLRPLRAKRDELEAASRQVERDIERARGLVAASQEAAGRMAEFAEQRDDARSEAARTVVDERLLQIAPDVDAVLQDESAAKQLAVSARKHEDRAAEVLRSAAAFEVPADVRDTPEARSKLESWRSRQAQLRSDVESTARTAESAAAHATSYRDATPAVQGRGSAVPGIVVLVLGLLAIAAGAVTRQWVSLELGAAAIVAGVLMLAFRRRTPGAGVGLAVDAVRLEAEASTAASIAALASERLATESAEWAEWLAERGLDARGTDPAAVSSLLDDARERAKLEEQGDSLRAEAGREREAAHEWAARLSSLVKGPLGIAETSPEPHALAIRAREALDAAKAARDRKATALRLAESAESQYQQAVSKREEALTALSALMTPYDRTGDPIAVLEDEAALAAAARDDAVEAYEELAREHNELVGKLGDQGREDALARHRQRLEGLTATAHAAGERHVVEAMAVHLVKAAQERFERDRQPDVVRTAGRVFSAMTGGRFVSVRVPLGGESITVVTASGEVLPTSRLSRGTAEQLYLALRVGLIESFGAQGPHLPVLMDDIVVNYDAERVRGAAAAVAELAATRQVVFFTCHEVTASVLEAAVPGTTSIRLERCSL